MRSLRLLVPCALLLAACDNQAKQQLATLAHSDSLRTDSLVGIKNDLLNEVMTSTQFVSAINDEMAKLKSAKKSVRLASGTASESEVTDVKAQRADVLKRIRSLVARLDSSEARVETLRARAAKLSQHDATLVAQVEQYSRTIADLRATVERQKAEYGVTIAALNSRIDTLNTANVQLSGEKAALNDTVSALNTEKNTVYYAVGTKDDLIKAGILVEEGRKRLLILGGRPVAPARELDPAKFTRIDRMQDRTINLPPGDFTIFSRQNPTYASPLVKKDGKISGGLHVDEPEKFWAPSRFLILVKG
jgi:hypothetical protein